MRIHISQLSKTFIASTALSIAGFAAAADALTSEFSFRVVETNAEGEEVLVERETVRPGEVISYELRHQNTTDGAMEGLVIAAPVPDGVSLALGSEVTSIAAVFEVQAEMDPEQEGLEWSTVPATRKIVDADGNMTEEPLPEDAVAAVRWTLSEPLEAGASAFNSYRVRLN